LDGRRTWLDFLANVQTRPASDNHGVAFFQTDNDLGLVWGAQSDFHFAFFESPVFGQNQKSGIVASGQGLQRNC
jgi:hypothetical protein